MSTVASVEPTLEQQTPPEQQALVRRSRFRLRPTRNPIVLKELRGRMRGMRAFVVMSVYLLLLSGFATLLYVVSSASLSYGGYYGGQIGQIGRILFVGIVGIELFLVTFIVPSFTAGAISGERERQTYDLLRTTLLPARSLVYGKLISALSYVLLLLLAAIPLQSIAFLFGGVTELEVILAFVILLVTSIALGAVGIYFSSVMQRTLSASVMSYAFTLFITLGLPLIALVLLSLLSPLGLVNSSTPFPVVAVLTYLFGFLIVTNPLATAFVTQSLLINGQGIGYFTQNIYANNQNYSLPMVSPWIPFTVLYLLLALVLIMLSIRRVKRIDK